jgi:hypothetical protein
MTKNSHNLKNNDYLFNYLTGSFGFVVQENRDNIQKYIEISSLKIDTFSKIG